jgi:hypothetical protein
MVEIPQPDIFWRPSDVGFSRGQIFFRGGLARGETPESGPSTSPRCEAAAHRERRVALRGVRTALSKNERRAAARDRRRVAP